MASFGYSFNWSNHLLTAPTGLLEPTAVSNNFVFTFYPTWYSNITLSWEVPDDWGAVTFNIFSGPSETGPFLKLNPTPFQAYTFRDATERDFSKYQGTFYVVEALFPNGRTVQSPPVTYRNTQSTWVSLRKNEISRREWLLLRKFVGVKSLLFRRKTKGIRCPECWNSDAQRLMKEKCPTCLGTSWEGGYHPHVETLLQYNITPNDSVLSYQGKTEPNQLQAWTIDIPSINDFDLILRYPDFRMYRVERVEPTELQAVTVRQVLVLTELSKESVEFELLKRLT